jgi:hypothetical protein
MSRVSQARPTSPGRPREEERTFFKIHGFKLFRWIRTRRRRDRAGTRMNLLGAMAGEVSPLNYKANDYRDTALWAGKRMIIYR